MGKFKINMAVVATDNYSFIQGLYIITLEEDFMSRAQ